MRVCVNYRCGQNARHVTRPFSTFIQIFHFSIISRRAVEIWSAKWPDFEFRIPGYCAPRRTRFVRFLPNKKSIHAIRRNAGEFRPDILSIRGNRRPRELENFLRSSLGRPFKVFEEVLNDLQLERAPVETEERKIDCDWLRGQEGSGQLSDPGPRIDFSVSYLICTPNEADRSVVP